jgi:hypothetical protein
MGGGEGMKIAIVDPTIPAVSTVKNG